MQPQDIVTSFNDLFNAAGLSPIVFDKRRMARLRKLCARPKLELNTVQIVWHKSHSLPKGFASSQHTLSFRFSEFGQVSIPAAGIPIALSANNIKVTLWHSYEKTFPLQSGNGFSTHMYHESCSFLYKV